jgi:succinoglycan biosynthesis protein ExoM
LTRICVIVCTCDRHDLLVGLLAALLPHLQEAEASLIVTDNGLKPAQAIVEPYKSRADVTYLPLTKRGLVAARNAGLASALGRNPEFIAFIDDDEVPAKDWLQRLLACLERERADIACGPYEPEFLMPPPDWARDGHFFRRKGDGILNGNLIVRSAVLPKNPAHWYQPSFAFIGGEDEEFFQRLIAQGARFAVAWDAIVIERIPPARMTLRYMLRSGFRDGIIEATLFRVQGKRAFGAVAKTAVHAAKKMGYAANNVFWVWREPWRSVAAMRDVSEAIGALLGALGVSGRFYG